MLRGYSSILADPKEEVSKRSRPKDGTLVLAFAITSVGNFPRQNRGFCYTGPSSKVVRVPSTNYRPDKGLRSGHTSRASDNSRGVGLGVREEQPNSSHLSPKQVAFAALVFQTPGPVTSSRFANNIC